MKNKGIVTSQISLHMGEKSERTGIRAHSLGGTLVCTGQLKRKDAQTPGQGVAKTPDRHNMKERVGLQR